MKRGNFIKFFCICTFLLCLVQIPLAAQSNALIDELLNEEQATFGKSAYLCLMAAKLIPNWAGVNEAMAYLQQANWGMTIKKADEPILLGELAYLLMKSLNISGGIMYSLAPGPRYACRELVYLDLISGRVSPNRFITGERALQIISNVVGWLEEGQ
ncbi:MAG: hypothetical protein JW822_14635 [Spirochaetales bacterium]|nr:hypothetical protein [Spirochaetales bacterium]